MRNIAANVLSLLILAGLLLVGGFGVARQAVSQPGPTATETVILVPKGASLRKISEIVDEAGLLPERFLFGAVTGESLFRMQAQYSGKAQSLKFGEYAIPAGASVDDIIAMLTQGGNVRHKITIPEGMTVAVAVERINAHALLTGEIKKMPTEGTLFPDTWEFLRGDDRQKLVDRMQQKMREELRNAWAFRAPGLPFKSPEEMLVLASIVEKETRPQEHAKVASVFINRMRIGMKLQTDPTVIYGITKGKKPLGRGLRKSELRAKTAYNTYVIDGLPPTPIANPGRESILAVANPETTNYLFFVADGTGGHAFAETLEQHNANVAVWRQIEAERKANQ